MGKKIRTVSDPALIKDHPSGAQVELQFSVVHDQFGMILYPAYRSLWYECATAADKAYIKLCSLEKGLLELPLKPSNLRVMPRGELLTKIIDCGTVLITDTYLALTHIVFGLGVTMFEGTAKAELFKAARLNEQCLMVCKELGMEKTPWSVGYNAFFGGEGIETIRHNLTHPKMGYSNGYENPVGWLIGGKFHKSKDALEFVAAISQRWQGQSARYSKSATLTIAQRGMRSEHQTKKPPQKLQT